LPGRLAIAPRPRSGVWLEDEIQDWVQLGVTIVVSLLTAEEVSELSLEDEERVVLAAGLMFVSVPVRDRDVPDSKSSFLATARRLHAELEVGANIVIHCRQGIGRSSLLASAVLHVAGLSVSDGFELIQKARGRPVPDTDAQRLWLQS